ncbi:hypothetical protein COCNU_scaffold005031G000030 [Cocos nucifera]|nr:hypothetical protein [Cocos nucifera]
MRCSPSSTTTASTIVHARPRAFTRRTEKIGLGHIDLGEIKRKNEEGAGNRGQRVERTDDCRLCCCSC